MNASTDLRQGSACVSCVCSVQGHSLVQRRVRLKLPGINCRKNQRLPRHTAVRACSVHYVQSKPVLSSKSHGAFCAIVLCSELQRFVSSLTVVDATVPVSALYTDALKPPSLDTESHWCHVLCLLRLLNRSADLHTWTSGQTSCLDMQCMHGTLKGSYAAQSCVV